MIWVFGHLGHPDSVLYYNEPLIYHITDQEMFAEQISKLEKSKNCTIPYHFIYYHGVSVIKSKSWVSRNKKLFIQGFLHKISD